MRRTALAAWNGFNKENLFLELLVLGRTALAAWNGFNAATAGL